MNTPVLLCVYRRLDKVLTLLDALRPIKPAVLYISANAPKNNEEKNYCDAIKKAIDNIDWDCVIHKKYELVHIPDCSASITNGINWFFSNVEYGMILEDDCLPTPSFFQLCSFLLKKYRNDNSVYHISGTNINYRHEGPPQLLSSSFSFPSWGWATWKRCWDKYNPEMNNWKDAEPEIKRIVSSFSFWKNFLEFNAETKTAWDIQWNVDIWANRGRILMPSYNLVSNIGFDKLATFTTNEKNNLSRLPTKEFTLPENHTVLPANDLILEENIMKLINNIGTDSNITF